MTGKDRDVLRRLVEKKAQIAALPIQKERAGMWARLNRLEKVRPMVWIHASETPWHELGVPEQVECEDAFCRELELDLRKTLYQWEHMQCDMVVENKMYCQLVIEDSGFGLEQAAERVKTSEKAVPSKHYEPQIKDEKDIDKIKDPVITLNEEETQRRYDLMDEAFGDIMAVEKHGIGRLWFSPWDYLITVWGVQEALMDMALRPDLVKAAMDRLLDAYMVKLDQYEKLNVLALNNDNTKIGSGGYGFIDELPRDDFDGEHVRTVDSWGCGTAQIFSEVSPGMHKEFALDFERRWLERFALTYYGCCEQLHNKIDILKEIPNLRKISTSPWADIEKMAEQTKGKYVLSCKPNPAIFVQDPWDGELARAWIVDIVEKAQGCPVEIIMKDISTVASDPGRLWEWATIASEVAESYG